MHSSLCGEGSAHQLILLLLVLLLLHLVLPQHYWSYGPKATIQILWQLYVKSCLSTSFVRCNDKGVKEPINPHCPVPGLLLGTVFRRCLCVVCRCRICRCCRFIALNDKEEKDENLLLLLGNFFPP